MVRMFLFRELLGAIRAKSATFFALAGVFLFLFLASIACFFMISPGSVTSIPAAQPTEIEEIRVFLSPRLASATIDQWFLEWRERADIAALRFEFSETGSGGLFVLTPTDNAMASELANELRQIEGVIEVVEVPLESAIETPTISLVIRVSLLVILLVAIVASLFCFRRGFHELLTAFSGEIRMLRLTGIAERIVSVLVVALGLMIGLLCGVFLLAILFLLHQIALSNAESLLFFGGLASGLRILGVGLTAMALGTVLGGLAGLLGASVLHGREFDALP